MKKILGVQAWLVIVIAALLVGVVAAPAGANGPNNKKLFGEYVLNMTANCGTCSAMFDTEELGPFGSNLPICPTSIPDVKASSHTWNAQGVFNFDGRGRFEFTGKYLAVLKDPMPILNPPIPPDPNNFKGIVPAIVAMELKCLHGSYTVNDDLTVDLRFGTTTEGCTVNLPGETLVHKILDMNLKGWLFDRMDGAMLSLNDTLSPDTLPNIETVKTFLPPSADTYRICGYSGTAMILRGTRGKSK